LQNVEKSLILLRIVSISYVLSKVEGYEMSRFRVELNSYFQQTKLVAGALCVLAIAPTTATAQMAADQTHEAQLRGLALVYASNVETDGTRAGLQLLKAAADAGDSAAMTDLGAVYLYGTVLPQDWPRALGYFEAAAQAGNPEGLYQYATMLMWSERAPARAEDMLRHAGDQGVTQAWVTLAEGAMYGYLGGGRISRAKFTHYAALGDAVAEEKIAVLRATRYMWGISVTASGPRTSAILEDAANAGNAEAAAFLIRLVRSGNAYNVRRDRTQASAYLEQYRSILSEAQAWQLQVSIEAAAANTAAAMADLVRTVDAQPQLMTQGFGADLMQANENAAIYVLQSRLSARGYSVGPVDGFAGTRTLQAMDSACRTSAPLAACNDSVMRGDVVSLLIENL
jgi:TPR repeat protein